MWHDGFVVSEHTMRAGQQVRVYFPADGGDAMVPVDDHTIAWRKAAGKWTRIGPREIQFALGQLDAVTESDSD
jgi:hypothetical protein